MSIFTERNHHDQVSKELRADRVLDFLSPFTTATIIYLEHLIYDRESKVSVESKVTSTMNIGAYYMYGVFVMLLSTLTACEHAAGRVCGVPWLLAFSLGLDS